MGGINGLPLRGRWTGAVGLQAVNGGVDGSYAVLPLYGRWTGVGGLQAANGGDGSYTGLVGL